MVGFEARVICADGSVRWLEWNTRSMPERGVVYSVGRDTTERRRVEAELREAQRLLEASRDELRVLAEEQAALRRVATLVARERVAGGGLRRGRRGGGAAPGRRGHGALPLRGRRDGDRRRGAGARRRRRRPGRHPLAARGRERRLARCFEPSGPPGSTTTRRPTGPIAGVSRAVGHPLARSAPDRRRRAALGRDDRRLRRSRAAAGRTPSRASAKFTELVATAISNTEARSELAASRARIVAATDEERRRVVRDLHDGAQQRLVHTSSR